MYIFKAAVVGAGAMGGGIAQVISFSGLPVVVKDIDAKQLELARQTVESIYQRRVDSGKMSAGQMQEKLDLIEYSLGYDSFGDVDIAIEAVPEKMEVKKPVLAELNGICGPDTIFASNTSALSITEMGMASGRPHKMIGMHFFNPAHIMKLVEVIPGKETDQDTIDTVEQFTQELRKIPVIVQECPGFLVNRLLMPYLNEATICLEQGTPAGEIDKAMGRDGFGWPMGPFTLMDMLGVDVCYHVGAYLKSQYGDRIAMSALFPKIFEAGRYGEKTQGGFYDYPGGLESPAVAAMIKELQETGQIEHIGSTFSPERLMVLLLNEAFMCVEENIANVNDIDMACIAGIGMQVRKGDEFVRMGPLEYADEVGLDVVLQQLEGYEKEFGLHFRPAEILRKKIKAGETGKAVGRGFKEYT